MIVVPRLGPGYLVLLEIYSTLYTLRSTTYPVRSETNFLTLSKACPYRCSVTPHTLVQPSRPHSSVLRLSLSCCYAGLCRLFLDHLAAARTRWHSALAWAILLGSALCFVRTNRDFPGPKKPRSQISFCHPRPTSPDVVNQARHSYSGKVLKFRNPIWRAAYHR